LSQQRMDTLSLERKGQGGNCCRRSIPRPRALTGLRPIEVRLIRLVPLARGDCHGPCRIRMCWWQIGAPHLNETASLCIVRTSIEMGAGVQVGASKSRDSTSSPAVQTCHHRISPSQLWCICSITTSWKCKTPQTHKLNGLLEWTEPSKYSKFLQNEYFNMYNFCLLGVLLQNAPVRGCLVITKCLYINSL
jgi:hypothetical protein